MENDLLTDLTNMASGARLDREDAIADLLVRAHVEIERLRLAIKSAIDTETPATCVGILGDAIANNN